jgi:predicted AAA+ superfamily ATPase
LQDANADIGRHATSHDRPRQPTRLNARPDKVLRRSPDKTMQKSPEEIAAEPDEMAAFNHDPHTWQFREYWQANDTRFVKLIEFVDSVAAGKTVVSSDVIAQCREAVLQINQINHVLTELSKGVGQASLVRAMNIAYAYDVRAAAARTHLHIIASWQAADSSHVVR